MEGRRGRGRHRNNVLMKVFLLGKPMSEVPTPSEQRKLTQSGLGSPKTINGSQCTFKKSWHLEEVENYLLSLYPGVPIDVIRYTFGKSSKLRKITRVEFQNIASLKRQVKKGKLFIIPKAEILAPQFHRSRPEPRPEPSHDDHQSSQGTPSNFTETDTPTIQFRRSRPEPRPEPSHDSSVVDTGQVFSSLISDSYEDFIEVIDSEDEELERALQASLLDAENSGNAGRETNTSNNTGIEDLLEAFQRDAVNESERTELIVFRKQVLEPAFRGISRPTFKLNAKVYVKFSGEIGQDYGGPRREFFRLAMKELHHSMMFEGEEGNRIFSHDISNLERKRYKMAGQLVALSLAQEGPGPGFLNDRLYEFMTEEKKQDGLACTTIIQELKTTLPEDMCRIMEELAALQTNTEREQFLVKHGEWFMDQGVQNIYRLSVENKEEFAQLLVKQYIFYRTSSEIQQFILGMNEVGNLWEMVKKNPVLFKNLFCHQPSALTKNQVEDLCTVVYSEEGSNKYSKEEETVYAWELFLQDIDEGSIPVTFQDLLAFITGADQIPPCGFSKPITINFFETEHGIRRLPHASTCSLELYLPRGVSDPNTLQKDLILSLKGSLGFEKI